MGVHGLWRLIEPSGKPVPLETLENKILAVDISIWLHQAVKGFQDSKGAPIPNSHLLGIYHRVCKLLYFKIKPVFIFDGGVPALKKQTIAKRNQQKSRNISETDRLQKQLISTLLKHSAVSKVLSEKTKASLTLPFKSKKHESIYALPSPKPDSTELDSLSEDEEMESTTDTDSSPTKHWDLHTIDMSSTHFRSLPVDVRHEILTELKETRKQNSWGRLHELPKQSDDFSSYQMKRLLKRQAVQSALEDAEKEMGGHSLSLAELESILKDHGVVTTNDIGKRIASDENTKFLLIKDLKQAIEKARQEQLKKDSIPKEESEEKDVDVLKKQSKADVEYEEDLEKAIALSLQEEPSTSKDETSSSISIKNKQRFSFLENFNDGDFESDVSDEIDVPVKKKLFSAQSYMIEYSGLTPSEINKILNDKNTVNSKGRIKNISKNLHTVSNENNDHQESEITEKQRIVLVDQIHIADSKFPKSKEPLQEESVHLSSDLNNDTIATAITPINEIEADTALNSDDASSNDEFEEVTEGTATKDNNSLEIVIDPSEKLEDDIFGDIFDNNVETKSSDVQKIVKEPVSELEKTVNENLPSEAEQNEIVTNKLETEQLDSTVANKNSEQVSSREHLDVPSSLEKFDGLDDSKNKNEDKSHGIKANDDSIKKLNVEEMAKLKSDLQKEKFDILTEKSTKERMASNITDQMYQEAQDLLELFGVPYLIAPMEAEAQCAFLDFIELTDGTITDDSDIWLFGGRTVYKNFFNQSKYVMEFKSENIKHHFKLTREQMILLAMLVGSDYTVGLPGVGPVTALEILASFPPTESKEFSMSHVELLSGLKEFRSWFNKGKTGGTGRSSLKNKLRNVTFTDNFPSLQVVQAYLEPTIETSKENFSWSKPDFVGLTDFAKEKFGWSSKKTEEILKPVMKKIQENQAQKTIKDYYKTIFKADSLDSRNQMSKRVKAALNRIGKSPEELIAEEMEALSKEKQKVLRNRKPRGKNKDESKSNSELNTDKTTKSRKKKSESNEINENSIGLSEIPAEPKLKIPRKRSKKGNESDSNLAPVDSSDTATANVDSNDLKRYENIAKELKKRRQVRSELSKVDEDESKKKKKRLQKKTTMDVIPEQLEKDDEIQLLQATTSKSLKRVEEINDDVKNKLELEAKKRCTSIVRNKEIIHQRLRNESNLLRNKLKAIEVFRKSKKGPGYVPKRGKKNVVLKDDAELSESSSD